MNADGQEERIGRRTENALLDEQQNTDSGRTPLSAGFV
jgi:hypothetical protein